MVGTAVVVGGGPAVVAAATSGGIDVAAETAGKGVVSLVVHAAAIAESAISKRNSPVVMVVSGFDATPVSFLADIEETDAGDGLVRSVIHADLAAAGAAVRGVYVAVELQPVQSGDAARILWLLLAFLVIVLILLFAVCTDSNDEPAAAPAPTTTTTATPSPTTATPTLDVVNTSAAGPTTVPSSPPATTLRPPTTTALSPTTQPGPIDISGTWTFLIDVAEATGACDGEEGDRVDPDTVTIAQEGNVLTVTGLNGEDPAWVGEILGNDVIFNGERNEDSGRTIASFIMTVDDAATVMSGIEEWTWSGPGGSCPGSLSEVSAER